MDNQTFSLIGVFFLGLGLNLTPCVYPMLSITASIFSSQKGATRLHSFLMALVYVLGIAAMYSVMGVVAALTGSLFGSLLQNPLILFGMGAVIFGLALSMFDVFIFHLPGWMMPKASEKKGVIGFFISGLFVGILAAPCVGPPVVALLTYVSSKQDPFFAFWMFFILSLGLGFPYLIFGTFSGLLESLPKSGMWMVWVKKVFGCVLIGLGIFYMLLAVKPEWYIWVLPLGCMIAGTWLGWIDSTGNDHPIFLWIKRIAGTIFVIFGVSLIVFFSNSKLGFEWQYYKKGMLESAKSSQQRVMIDFYADWCIPCHELDQITYRDEGVVEALSDYVKIKVDLTKPDEDSVLDLTDQFNVVGVPTVIFLDESGAEISDWRITGFVPPDQFLEKMGVSAPE